MKAKFLLFLSIILILINSLSAQKVGLVLSGGGAKGIAHLGVIRVLEENGIPIDYIAGTSMGAIVGGLYASGYSPDEMEELFTSKEFLAWSRGIIQTQYRYFYKKAEPDPGWFNVKIARIDDKLKILPPTSLIPPDQMNFAFMELCAQTNAVIKGDFNNLMVPFFCVATDIEKNEQVVLRSGNLGDAIRSSMTVPLYFKPIRIDSTLLFDGGIINNFPQNEMADFFKPDIIIGHNVANTRNEVPEEDVVQQVLALVMRDTDYNMDSTRGIYLKTDFENIGLMDFNRAEFIAQKGEETANSVIDSITSRIKRRVDKESVNSMRADFNSKKPPLVFENIQVEGIENPNQREFIIRAIKNNKQTIDLEELRSEYFKLVADNHLKSIRPVAVYNETNKTFDLNLIVEPERKFELKMGGNISTKPINIGFGSLDYRFYNKVAYTISGNFYFGRFYDSIKMGGRIDIPRSTPFYLLSYLTYNRWNFFTDQSQLFLSDLNTPHVKQNEYNFRLEMGIPLSTHNKLSGGTGWSFSDDRYYQLKNNFKNPNESKFNSLFFHSELEYNSLNNKQFPTDGTSNLVQLKYIIGNERNKTYVEEDVVKKRKFKHSYFIAKARREQYYTVNNLITLGFEAEGLYSNKDFFYSYNTTKMAAPFYAPTPHSKTLYIENFRSNKYIAGGLKSIFHIDKSLNVRVEGYSFIPIREIHEENGILKKHKNIFSDINLQAMAALVYDTNIGPASLAISYYEKKKSNFYISLSFGYIIFNKRGY